MSKAEALRFAPSQDSIQTANAWRVWNQGDEFYAAPRILARVGKISFHRNEHWLYTVGHAAFPLAAPLRFSGGWLHACELSFLITPGVMLPLGEREQAVRLVETPADYKLVVNILVSTNPARPQVVPPPEVGGTRLMSSRLRSGNSLLVTYRVLPMSANDAAIAADVQDKLRIGVTSQPAPGDFYAEASWHNFSPATGNVLVIVPVGPGALAVDGGRDKSAT